MNLYAKLYHGDMTYLDIAVRMLYTMKLHNTMYLRKLLYSVNLLLDFCCTRVLLMLLWQYWDYQW